MLNLNGLSQCQWGRMTLTPFLTFSCEAIEQKVSKSYVPIDTRPGGMRISIEDAVSGGLSDPRNQTLIKLFNLIDIGERAGSGLPNIFAVWSSQKWPEPTLEEQFDPERTTLSLVLSPQNDNKVAIKSGDKERMSVGAAKKQLILEYLVERGVGKTKDISELLSVNASRTRVYLKELVIEGKIVADGANRNRVYRPKVQESDADAY